MNDAKSVHETDAQPWQCSWPPDRFYWAVLDVPGVPIRSPRPPGAEALDLALSDEVPLPMEGLHAVYARLDDPRVLACAAPRTDLTALDAGALELLPSALPDFVGRPVNDLSLNLLVGDFEPVTLRRARRTHAHALAATILVLSCLAAIGLLRRASYAEETVLAADRDAVRAAAAAMPDVPRDSALLTIRLRDELDLLRRTRRPQAVHSFDAAVTLADVLAAWPATLPASSPASTQTISITPTSLSMIVGLEQDAATFLDGLGTPPGWRRNEPRVTRSASGVQTSIQYQREGTR